MPTLKANHRVIAAACAIGGRRTRYRIEGVDGLWLDVGPRGKRIWYVRYQPGGRMTRHFRYYKIGPLEDVSLAAATRRAKDVIGDVYGKQKDPQAERVARNRQGTTFGELFEDWFARHAEPTLARAATDRIVYRCHIEGGFSKKRIVDLKRIEIGRFRDKVAKDASPLTSNSVVELINRVLNWAVDEGIIEVNPAARLRKVGIKRPRERVLAEADIPKFWNALAAMETMTGQHMARAEKGRMLSPATRSILRLLLLTGQRRGEVVEAQKSEFALDGDEPVWTIPGARTKNRLLHRLPLCPMAAAEFRKAFAASPKKSPFVFPSPEDPLKRPISAEAVTRAMARVIAELKIPTVSPHDLRRTVGTGMAQLGLPVHVRSLVLNHSPMSRGITDAVYNRYAYDKEKREALAAWEGCLQALILSRQPEAPAIAAE
ncbi:MAG: site-specific integrase [Hyphomicrobium sp.]|nr:site-specific integrase [Hyphomicrobium sp.]